MNSRRLKAVSRRITNKALAEELGISTSTLYRYKSGKVKNPKTDIDTKVNRLWDSLKDTPTAKNLKQKRKIEDTYKEPTYFKDTKFYPKENSIHHIYKIKYLDDQTIEDVTSELHYKYGYEFFFIRITGKDENGNERQFSTPISTYQDIDQDALLQQNFNALMSKPSKTLSHAIHYEIIVKEFVEV